MFKRLPGSVFTLTVFFILLVAAGTIGGFYYFLNSNLSQNLSLSRGPVTSEPVSFNLTISSPDDNLLVFSPDLVVEGKTTPGSTVLISFEDSDLTLDIGGSGDFSQTVKLDEGVNQFTVTSFDPTGNSKSESRTVYYSKEKI